MMPLRRQAMLRHVEPSPPRWDRAFGRKASLEVELGCGRGRYAWERARRCPEVDIVALDTRRKWIDLLRSRCCAENVSNLRAIRCDVTEDLPLLFGVGSVSAFVIHHPDPWWKKRHRKRRLIHSEFVDLLERLLKPGGLFFMQSDVPDLISESRDVFSEHSGFQSIDGEAVKRDWMFSLRSHREARCLQLGIPIQRIAYIRSSP